MPQNAVGQSVSVSGAENLSDFWVILMKAATWSVGLVSSQLVTLWAESVIK